MEPVSWSAVVVRRWPCCYPRAQKVALVSWVCTKATLWPVVVTTRPPCGRVDANTVTLWPAVAHTGRLLPLPGAHKATSNNGCQARVMRILDCLCGSFSQSSMKEPDRPCSAASASSVSVR